MSESDTVSIWHVIWGLGIGGAETTIVDLANNLNHEKFDVTVCTIESTNPLAERLSNEVKFRSIKAKQKESISTTAKFFNVVRRESPDILQSFLTYANTVTPYASLLTPDTKVLTGIRAVPENPNPFIERLERSGLKRSDCVVSNSKAGKQYGINRGINPDKIRVIPNGRDIKKYSTAPPASDIDEFRGSSISKIVGTVGRLIERKGHADLLEAWPNVLKVHPNSKLVITGDGPERSRLEAKSKQLGVSESVKFTGTRSDVPSVLAALDVFVFPSHYEGLPGALIEAMAAGLPIVCTPVDGNSELVSDGESGLYSDVRCPDQLSNRLIEVLSDNDLARRLADSAQNRAKNRYSLEIMVENFSSLYHEQALI